MASGLPTPPHHEATQVAMTPSANRAEGSFGNAFASLSSETNKLPPRFKELKLQLIGNNEDAILASWQRLLEVIARLIYNSPDQELGSKINSVRGIFRYQGRQAS
jgi:hypothetical protein